MSAALHDSTVIHHDNKIGAPQRAQPVGDNERGASRDRAIERLENFVLG